MSTSIIYRPGKFGSVLRDQRERVGLSQSKLAEAAEFDHSYVSRIEGGARYPSRDAVERFADVLDLAKGTPQRELFLASAGFVSDLVLALPPDLQTLAALLPDAPDPLRVYAEGQIAALVLLLQDGRHS